MYLWMMLDIIVNITPDVASGLKDRIKLLVSKGLNRFYPKGENVERLVLDYSSICHSLDQLGILAEDAIADVIKSLVLVTHVEFAKMFSDFASDLKNPLMSLDLKGTVMEQIVTAFKTALVQYTLYYLSSQ